MMTESMAPTTEGLALKLAEMINDGDMTVDQALPVPTNFRFVWEGIRFHGSLDGANLSSDEQIVNAGRLDQSIYLTLRAEMGAVPYTAEDHARRHTALKFAGQQNMGSGNTQRVNEKQCLEFEAITKMENSTTARDIMTAVVVILLQMTRYFEGALEVLPDNIESDLNLFAVERKVKLH